MDRKQIEELKAKAHADVIAAEHSLGKALLVKGTEVPEARRMLAAAKKQLGDAEAMLRALDELEEPERLWEEEVAWKTMPRVAHAEYQAAKKRFETEYDKLKGTEDLKVRGAELLALATKSGESDLNDCKRFLGAFDGSPELKSLR